MKSWCHWTIFGLILLVYSGLASSLGAETSFVPSKPGLVSKSHPALSLQSVINLQVVSIGEIKVQKNLAGKSSLDECDKLLSATSASKGFSSDNLPSVPICASAMLFRDNLQTKPVFRLKPEFIPFDFETHLFLDFRFKKNDSPWFMQSRLKSNGRVSGWKDGNSLYTANITYH